MPVILSFLITRDLYSRLFQIVRFRENCKKELKDNQG